MKNYRTTLLGAALAALSFLAIYQSNGGDLAHWQQWLIPVALAALGYVAKDAGVTGAIKLLIATLCLLTLPACTVDWQRAAIAATNAAAPVVLDGLNKPAAKQPKNVQP
jgi:hypothetical protein